MYYWVCPFKAQISHIYMWLVVSRESYGEKSAPLFIILYNPLKLKSQQEKTDKTAHEKIISSFRGNYATCYVNKGTKL